MPKSIFITGGTSGIGLATARKYKSEGYRVGVCGRNQEVLDSLKDEFQVYKVDVVNLADVKKAIEDFATDGLDIVIANAEIGYSNKKDTPDFDMARKIMDINVTGVFNTFEVATEIFLKQRSGHLVGVASLAGLNGLPGVPAYSGSKAAVIKICESLNIDLRKFGINVTCINPGFIDTPLTQKNKHPMPFLATADDMANAIFNGVKKKKANVYYPRLFSGVVLTLSFLPRILYRYIISGGKYNYTKY